MSESGCAWCAASVSISTGRLVELVDGGLQRSRCDSGHLRPGVSRASLPLACCLTGREHRARSRKPSDGTENGWVRGRTRPGRARRLSSLPTRRASCSTTVWLMSANWFFEKRVSRDQEIHGLWSQTARSISSAQALTGRRRPCAGWRGRRAAWSPRSSMRRMLVRWLVEEVLCLRSSGVWTRAPPRRGRRARWRELDAALLAKLVGRGCSTWRTPSGVPTLARSFWSCSPFSMRMGDVDLALAGEERDLPHLAQIHAHRVGAVAAAAVAVVAAHVADALGAARVAGPRLDAPRRRSRRRGPTRRRDCSWLNELVLGRASFDVGAGSGSPCGGPRPWSFCTLAQALEASPASSSSDAIQGRVDLGEPFASAASGPLRDPRSPPPPRVRALPPPCSTRGASGSRLFHVGFAVRLESWPPWESCVAELARRLDSPTAIISLALDQASGRGVASGGDGGGHGVRIPSDGCCGRRACSNGIFFAALVLGVTASRWALTRGVASICFCSRSAQDRFGIAAFRGNQADRVSRTVLSAVDAF